MKNVKKLFKVVGLFGSAVSQTAILALAIGLIAATAYIVGYRYLTGNTFWGNDSFSYFSVVNWFNQFYPRMPFWYPLQGGGVSLWAGYPWLAAEAVIVLSRMASLDLAAAFRLLGFLSVPLTSIGIFVLVWARLTDVKPVWLRQVLGLIAALFYNISPMAWIWLTRWGFYSENVSHIFIPWSILFFDLFVERVFEKKYDFWCRLAFVFTGITWVLGTLTHFFVGIGMIPIFAILVLARFLFWKENRLALLKRVAVPLLAVGVVMAGLFIFRYYPFARFNKFVAVGGFTGYAAASAASYEETAKNMLPPRMMLSLDMPIRDIHDFINFSRATIADMSFPFYIWLLAVPALLFSFFRSKKIFLLSVYAAIGFVINTNVDLKIYLANHLGVFSFILGLITGRVFFIGMAIIIPILSVYGGYIVWELIGLLLLRLVRGVKVLYYTILPLKIVMVCSLSLVTIGYVVYRSYNLPYPRYVINAGSFDDKVNIDDIWHRLPTPSYTAEDLANPRMADKVNGLPANFDYMSSLCLRDSNAVYGKDNICNYYKLREASKAGKMLSVFPPGEVVDRAKAICDKTDASRYGGELIYCNAFYKPLREQLAWKNWEKVKISTDLSGEIGGIEKTFAILPKDKPFRFDISGYTGRYVMATPLVTNNSQMQTYINTLSLLYNNWNYQTQAMYTKFPLYQKPGVLSEIAKWYGFNYVLLTGAPQEPSGDYEADVNWERWKATNWMHFKPEPALVDWDKRPRMLMISDNKKYFYDQTFRFFTWGGLGFDEAIPVMGAKEVDSYSLAELKKFEAVMMRGYGYKSTGGAYGLLDRYVKEGGKLIFDTGWQYYVPDYQLKRAPAFMPFESLSWKNLDVNGNFSVVDKTIAGEIDPSKMGSLTWEKTAWGVSAPGGLRSWAKAVVSYDGTPLVVAGQYGKGKVVWLGFNIIPHAEAKNNTEEIKLFSNLMKYIFPDSGKTAEKLKINMERLDPDKVEFTFGEDVAVATSLYFREAYYPDWKATLISGRKRMGLSVLRAGPGFMAVGLPAVSNGDKLVLEIKKPGLQILVEILSGLTLAGLLIYLVRPRVLSDLAKRVVSRKISLRPVWRFRGRLKRKVSGGYNKWTKNEDEDY